MANENADTARNTMTIDIIYEDNDVVVIDKPPGVMVHPAHAQRAGGPDGYEKGQTVSDWFLERYREAKDVGEPMALKSGEVIDRPGIVHRLDTETSGVMVLAKNQDTFVHLKAQFHDRHVVKEYRAFVYGKVKEKRGTIDRKIGRSAKDFRLRSAQRGAKGMLRGAVTDWELLGGNDEYSYLKLIPKTGRTHQIRVHAKAINHPVVCDRLYAPNHECALGFDRLALHAHKLTVTLPSGKEYTFESPLSQVFTNAEEELRT